MQHNRSVPQDEMQLFYGRIEISKQERVIVAGGVWAMHAKIYAGRA